MAAQYRALRLWTRRRGTNRLCRPRRLPAEVLRLRPMRAGVVLLSWFGSPCRITPARRRHPAPPSRSADVPPTETALARAACERAARAFITASVLRPPFCCCFQAVCLPTALALPVCPRDFGMSRRQLGQKDITSLRRWKRFRRLYRHRMIVVARRRAAKATDK